MFTTAGHGERGGRNPLNGRINNGARRPSAAHLEEHGPHRERVVTAAVVAAVGRRGEWDCEVPHDEEEHEEPLEGMIEETDVTHRREVIAVVVVVHVRGDSRRGHTQTRARAR